MNTAICQMQHTDLIWGVTCHKHWLQSKCCWNNSAYISYKHRFENSFKTNKYIKLMYVPPVNKIFHFVLTVDISMYWSIEGMRSWRIKVLEDWKCRRFKLLKNKVLKKWGVEELKCWRIEVLKLKCWRIEVIKNWSIEEVNCCRSVENFKRWRIDVFKNWSEKWWRI